MAPPSQSEFVKAMRQPPPPGSPYSVPLAGTEREGRSPIYRHFRCANTPLVSTLHPDIRTAHDSFEHSAKQKPNARCLGTRPYDPVTKTWGKYEWINYAETAAQRKNFGAGLVQLHRNAGIMGSKYGVGLWCQNRAEWQIADLACQSQSLHTVSIYDSLGPDTTEYIINHASLACVVTSLAHIPALLKLAPRLPTLKLIVCMDPIDAGERPGNSKKDILTSLAAGMGISIHYMGDIEALGAASGLPMNPPVPEDIITINYTSGTTGNPKGVVLTHANAVAAITVSRLISDTEPTDVAVSYLPLAHIYQRLTEQNALSANASIGYFRGDILGLVDDMKVLQPTGFNSVPRLFNRFGTAIRAATIEAPGMKGAIGRHVINAKLASMKLPAGQATNKHLLYDRFFTPKVKAAVGLTRARGMITGSAPLDPQLHQFLRAAFGCDFIQGYGLTESYAVSLSQAVDDFSAGNCGGVAVSFEACLQSVTDMDYLVTDTPNPRGELLLKGVALFKEYYKNDAETKKAFTEDGWFRTGDIVEIDSMGRFKIVDRVKNVLKLAQGEYISPERIENVYLANNGVLTQGYVHGDSHQSFLVSVWAVDPATFAPFASRVLKQTIDPTDLDAIKVACQDKRVRKALLSDLDKIGRANKFNSYERVRAVHLEIEPFTIENQLLTPTLKLKRPQTAKKFRKEIDRMYEEVLAGERTQAKL